MLEGWIIASSYGSMTIRFASISARMSRSESSTRTTYPAARGAGSGSHNGDHELHAGTSPSATPSPRASATPTPSRPNGCAAGPTGWPRCWPTRDPAASATPTWPSAAASCAASRRAARAGAGARARPGHVVRRRQRHPAAARGHRRPRAAYDEAVGRLAATGADRRAVHRLRPRRLGDLPAAARPVRALHRGRPRDRRPARHAARRLLADARVPRLAATGTPTGCTSARPATSGWRCAVLDALEVPHALEALPPTVRPELTGRELRAKNVEWVRTHAVPVGAPARSPAGPRATASRPKRPTLAPIDALPGRVTSPASVGHPGRTACGCSSVGRARPSQGRCREFESRHPLHEFRQVSPRRRSTSTTTSSSTTPSRSGRRTSTSTTRPSARPMLALTAALAEEFGQAKVFRPYRDVRFAKDKTPYKNHQGAFVSVGPGDRLVRRDRRAGRPRRRRLLPRGRPRPGPHPDRHRHRALRPGARADRRRT